MSKLRTLHAQLDSLRRSRQWFRWGTGYAGLLIALFCILAVVFLLDFGFKLEVPQRAIVMVIGLAALVWAAMRFTAPFLGIRETPIDMALMVERQQGIDSDLVAALQFESPEAGKWGSRELEDAVIDYVAQLDRGLDVYQGFSRKQLWTRLGVLAATLLVAFVLIVAPLTAPYAKAFFMRLALDNLHYPSATSIDRVLVNGDEVLNRTQHGTSPVAARSAQSQPIVFAAWASGEMPTSGVAKVRPVEGPGSGRPIEMSVVPREKIEDAVKLLRRQLSPADPKDETALADLNSQSREELTTLVAKLTRSDPAEIGAAIDQPLEANQKLANIAQRLHQLLRQWPSEKNTQLYVGKMPRLADKVAYKIELGDAWTDPATISMIELPNIEPNIEEIAPDYARMPELRPAGDRRSLQRSVIEGSQLRLAIGTNKPLKQATLSIITTDAGKESIATYAFKKLPGKASDNWPTVEEGQNLPQEVWRLNPAGTELDQIRGPLRFEIQVVDTDGLSLETPLRGNIRLKVDHPPRVSGSLAYRTVVPTAKPEIELRASDDYGIAALHVNVSVVRGEFGQRKSAGLANEASFFVDRLYELRGNRTYEEAKQRTPVKVAYPLQGEALPAVGGFKLDLSSLGLQRGDELRIVLAATDHRGPSPGVTTESEPILLEVAAEDGVVVSVAELDRRSQEQIDDLIRRQLGIGEAP